MATGLYRIRGFVRLEGVDKDEQLSLGRLLTGMVFVPPVPLHSVYASVQIVASLEICSLYWVA